MAAAPGTTPPAFTPQQLELIERLKADVAPIVENNAALKLWVSSGGDHTYVRYLRARKWNFQQASKMLHATLEWRMEYRPELIRFDEIKEETVTGKNHIYHVPDKFNRPIVMMRPRLENTKTYDRQIRFLMYLLEQASRTADERGVHWMTWLLDMEGYTMSTAPPLRTSIYCNHVLQNHYPERLGTAVLYHAPMLFSLTWRAVKPFIDVVTQKKILFADKGQPEVTIMNEYFDMQQMESCIGGGLEGMAFNWDKFEAECRAYDAKVDAELKTVEAQLKEKSLSSGAVADKVGSKVAGSDLDVDVAEATEKLEAVAVRA